MMTPAVCVLVCVLPASAALCHCQACAVGSSSEGRQDVCARCPVDQYWIPVLPAGSDCRKCFGVRASTNGLTGQTACQCNPGWAGTPAPPNANGQMCVDCDCNSYTWQIGTSSCLPCNPESTITNCNEGALRNQ